MSRLARGAATLGLFALPAAMMLQAGISLRAELLARRGLAGWDRILVEPGGDREALRGAHAIDPWRWEVQVALGLCRDLPVTERERLLLRAARRAPSRPLAYLALGALRKEQGSEEAAAGLYRVAAEVDPMGSATRIRLAALFIDQMDLEEAAAHLRAAARLSPDKRLIEALSLAAGVTTDEALISSLVPPGPRQHLAAARYLEEQGLDAVAESQYEKASAAEPASRTIHESHVRFHLRLGQRGDAIRLIRARLAVVPGDLPLRVQLAQLLMDEGRKAEAALALRDAELAAPASDEVANQRALLELELGDPERASELAAALVDRRPEMASARVTLARALWKRGDRAGAARELAQAEALDAGRAEVQLLLARLNREIGNEIEAAARYRKAIQMGYASPAREELSALTAASGANDGG